MTTPTESRVGRQVDQILELLKTRSGLDTNGYTAAEWSQDIQFASDFIEDMHPNDFALLLEIVAHLPHQHPLRIRLENCIEEMNP